jgi:hypothetical protein
MTVAMLVQIRVLTVGRLQRHRLNKLPAGKDGWCCQTGLN